ncbi:MAG TPA: 4-(cytidine 5'-diphospho)-2-C-methyl-D-erythritol kinase [Thermoanaerobaculia bacterium]|nr:4-(cytidine 5'-diphospho)-2-C-methyl-D-erythritol kinase [Thermoanaerobaculia bacterium]
MRQITVRSHAKINWLLRVLGRRDDGYHDIETIFQSISLHDRITIREAPSLELRCDDPSIPAGEQNLVVRAWRALHDRHRIPPVAIDLGKRIPAGGGLGGGSSNAAATLRALSRLFALPADELPEIALALGSDVPFFLVGGTALGEGRGEMLEPLPDIAPIPLLLLFPEERVPTGEAFAALRADGASVRRSDAGRLRRIAGDPLAAARELTNDFESTVFARLPRLEELKQMLLERGARWAGMTGSGSTIVGAFATEPARDAVIAELAAGIDAVPAETISRSEALA